MKKRTSETGQHSIGIAARYSGLSAEVIRAWERRYRVVAPKRMPNARRVYSDDDIERLALLARATAAGRRIGDIAKLSNNRLSKLIDQSRDADAGLPGEQRRQSTAAVMEYFDSCIVAINNLNIHDFIAVLSRAEQSLGMFFLIEDLITPLLSHVRDECRRGTLPNGHRHLFTGTISAWLLMQAAAHDHPQRKAVVCTVEKDPELSALKAAAVMNANGWDTIHPGENTAPEEIAGIAVSAKAQTVIICSNTATEDDDVPNRIRLLRKQLPTSPLIVHTPAGGHYLAIIGEINAIHCNNLRQLCFELERLTPP